MIDLLFVGLLSFIAGDPALSEQPAAPEASVQEPSGAASPAEGAANTDAPAAPAEQQASGPAQPTQYRRERRCREVEVTGRRMPQRVCQNVMAPVEESTATTP